MLMIQGDTIVLMKSSLKNLGKLCKAWVSKQATKKVKNDFFRTIKVSLNTLLRTCSNLLKTERLTTFKFRISYY